MPDLYGNPLPGEGGPDLPQSPTQLPSGWAQFQRFTAPFFPWQATRGAHDQWNPVVDRFGNPSTRPEDGALGPRAGGPARQITPIPTPGTPPQGTDGPMAYPPDVVGPPPPTPMPVPEPEVARPSPASPNPAPAAPETAPAPTPPVAPPVAPPVGALQQARPAPTAPTAPSAPPPPSPAAARGPSMSDEDIDATVRTVLGEAGNQGPEGWRAVAAVIRNRSASSGMTAREVVRAPGQFEPWQTRRQQLEAIDPNSPEYQRVRAAIAPVLSGEAPDPTGGADHFYAPRAQAALGRNAPAWAQGAGQDIGDHRFYRLGYRGQQSTPQEPGPPQSPPGPQTPVPPAPTAAAPPPAPTPFPGDEAPTPTAGPRPAPFFEPRLLALASGLFAGRNPRESLALGARGLGEAQQHEVATNQRDRQFDAQQQNSAATRAIARAQLGLTARGQDITAGNAAATRELTAARLSIAQQRADEGARTPISDLGAHVDAEGTPVRLGLNRSTGGYTIDGQPVTAEQLAARRLRRTADDADVQAGVSTARSAGGAQGKDSEEDFSAASNAWREASTRRADIARTRELITKEGATGPTVADRVRRGFVELTGLDAGQLTPSGLSLSRTSIEALSQGQIRGMLSGQGAVSEWERRNAAQSMVNLQTNPQAASVLLDLMDQVENRKLELQRRWDTLSPPEQRAIRTGGGFRSWQDRQVNELAQARGISVNQPVSPDVQPSPNGWQTTPGGARFRFN